MVDLSMYTNHRIGDMYYNSFLFEASLNADRKLNLTPSSSKTFFYPPITDKAKPPIWEVVFVYNTRYKTTSCKSLTFIFNYLQSLPLHSKNRYSIPKISL